MVPETFNNFFLASAGIGATLVGLIFVAVSIAPEHIVQANAPIERQAMAASSFTALLNAFFISLGALIPGIIGSLTLVMSAFGFIIYGFEFYYAILIIKEPDNVGNFYTLAALLLAVYGIGLTRAWQLLGA